MELITQRAEETRELGEALGRTARAGDVLWLHGELGAGKTELTKALPPAWEAAPPSHRPALRSSMNTRGAACLLFHIDLYRLEGERRPRTGSGRLPRR